MNLRESIKRILREELTPSARRRINFGNIDSILKKQRIGSFQKDQPIDSSINRTIHLTMYDVMPREFEDNDEEYFKVWDGIKKYLKDTYSDELTQYFEKRQRDADEDKNPLGIKYVFIKHDKPYNNSSGWRGFADGFDSFDEMITKYGSYVDVDWDEIKRKLDTINDYPVETFNNTRNSYPLRISNIGDEGNNWGYHFSIIKQIPKDNVDVDTNKIKGIQTEKIEDELGEYARTLKNARKQGSGLRFPKSAIKSNPLRFRPYNREMVDENDPKVGTGKKPVQIFKNGEGSDFADKYQGDIKKIPVIDTVRNEPFKDMSYMKEKGKTYIDALNNGEEWMNKPIVAIVHPYDSSKYVVVDGNHRLYAFKETNTPKVNAIIIPHEDVVLMKNKWGDENEESINLTDVIDDKEVIDKYFVKPNGTNNFDKPIQENINRIKEMMGINENKSKKEFLFSYLDKNGFDSKPIKKLLSIEDNDWSQYVKEYLGDNYEKVIEDDVRNLVENFTECNGDIFGLEFVSIFFGGGSWQDTSYSINIRINPESPVFETIDLNDYEDVLTLFGQIEGCVEDYLNNIIYNKYGAANYHTLVQVG